MDCPKCGKTLVHYADLRKKKQEHTMRCECGYCEPTTEKEAVKRQAELIRSRRGKPC